jgi:23S rRNA (cytidine2498-2'-O)-methyltransferase
MHAVPNIRIPYVLGYCRAGFEGECAAEIAARAAAHGISGHVAAAAQEACAIFRFDPPVPLATVDRVLRLRDLAFARQLVFGARHLDELPAGNRIAPLAQAAAQFEVRFSEVLLETADTNQGKALSTLCRRLAGRLNAALAEAGLLVPEAGNAPSLHVFFAASRDAHVGISLPGNRSGWPMGIPRLRMPRDAPSRSTLKLAEALLTLLDDDERTNLLRPGMRAVDLGAAPGGWTWQLASRGLHVTAIDNGSIAPSVMATGMVEHLRSDGFTWRPRRPVDWLLCDMAAQPARIAVLVADWLARGQARHALFNLKLPMKKRLEEVDRCRGLIEQRLHAAGQRATLRIKQLYHDREEVTACMLRD